MTPIDLKQFEGHTPGPWEQDSAKMEMTYDSRYQIIHGQVPNGINGDFGYPVADTLNRHHCIFPEEDEANARLIAAAPTLLRENAAKDELLTKIRETLAKTPTITGMCPPADDAGIVMAIRSLQEIMVDCTAHRDRINPKLRGENAELREHIKIQEEYLRAAHAARDAFEGDVDTLGEQLEEARRDNELFLANVDHFQNKLRSAESSLRVMREQLVHAVSCMNRG